MGKILFSLKIVGFIFFQSPIQLGNKTFRTKKFLFSTNASVNKKLSELAFLRHGIEKYHHGIEKYQYFFAMIQYRSFCHRLYIFYCKCHDEQFHFINPQDDMIEKTTYPGNISNDESK